ncbi:MAG TPA: hypothetical protein DCF81_14180 [Erythrobacter sp.]|nr:hypothetical protein [Erythrobacter sp.]
MIGASWEHKSFGDREMKSYRWIEPGVAMLVTSAKVGNDAYFVARPYQTVVGFDPVSGLTSLGTRGTPEGGMVQPDRNGFRGEYQWLDDAHYRGIFYQKKDNGSWKKLLTNNFYRQRGGDVQAEFAAALNDETDKGLNLGGSFGDMVAGAIMGAATG